MPLKLMRAFLWPTGSAGGLRASILVDPALIESLIAVGDIDASVPDQRLLDRFGRGIGAGLAVLGDSAREVATQVLPHVFAVVPIQSEEVLSASARELPGIVFLAADAEPGLAAEGMFHEAVHQQLFDLEVARDFAYDDVNASKVRITWGSEGERWPLSQCIAGCHAYGYLKEASLLLPAGSGPSLLSDAARRFELLLRALRARRPWLGADADELFGAVGGWSPSNASTSGSVRQETTYSVPPFLSRQAASGRVILAALREDSEIQLFWLGADEFGVLQGADGQSVGDLRERFRAQVTTDPTWLPSILGLLQNYNLVVPSS